MVVSNYLMLASTFGIVVGVMYTYSIGPKDCDLNACDPGLVYETGRNAIGKENEIGYFIDGDGL